MANKLPRHRPPIWSKCPPAGTLDTLSAAYYRSLTSCRVSDVHRRTVQSRMVDAAYRLDHKVRRFDVNVVVASGRDRIASIFECRQRIQHLTGLRSTEDRIVLANSSVAEDQHTLGKLCDVMFVCYQNDG